MELLIEPCPGREHSWPWLRSLRKRLDSRVSKTRTWHRHRKPIDHRDFGRYSDSGVSRDPDMQQPSSDTNSGMPA